VQFTLVHAGKHRRQIKRRDNTESKHNPEKAKTQNVAKRNYPGSVTSYDTQSGNKVGLFCNAPKRTRSRMSSRKMSYLQTFQWHMTHYWN